MRALIIVVMVVVSLWLGLAACFHRYSTNTAAGRFYKNDRWTGQTLVVEKDGTSHWLEGPK